MSNLFSRYANAWLTGQAPDIKRIPMLSDQRQCFVLLGGPGVGKGTQSDYLFQRFGCLPLSTGEVFRAARKSTDPSTISPAMKEAFEYMDKGLLVPDDTVVKIVRERAFCLNAPMGFMLDGFPRTIDQAVAVDEMLLEAEEKLTAVIYYELPIEETVARLSGRRTCPNCKATFHTLYKAPRVDEVCDRCGAALLQRTDDKPESVRTRLEAYAENTAPLIDFYDKKGLLVRIDASGKPEDVFEKTKAALVERNQPKTIFKSIIDGECPCNKLYEDDQCIAFRDINPQAPTHVLIVPKKEIQSLNTMLPIDEQLVGHLLYVAMKIAEKESISDTGYRTFFNCGKDAGMDVPHLHLHLIGGKKL